MFVPKLERIACGDLAVWTDPGLATQGIRIAFTERGGGMSAAPYAALDLAHHVGDAPEVVDANRTKLLECLGMAALRNRLITAEQVHGDHVAVMGEADAGRGAARVATSDAASQAGRDVPDAVTVGLRPPVERTDALVTSTLALPLMLLFADCVPVVVAAPGRGVAVAHAGWRGALARIPEKTVAALCRETGCRPSDVVAYIGPHICPECYEVSDDIMSQFANTFDTVSRASGRHLDLSLSVTESLVDAGVETCRIARLGVCTAQATDRFYSYRAEAGRTGRHAALACILGSLPPF